MVGRQQKQSIMATDLITLPEELLSSILSNLPSKELAHISRVCRRIASTAATLLSHRLRMGSLAGYQLICEVATPARRTLTPYQLCVAKGPNQPISPNSALSEIYTRFSADGRIQTAVSMEQLEQFTQLCANAVMLKMDPHAGCYSSLERVFDNTFFRLRRSELRAMGAAGMVKTVWLGDGNDVALRFRVLRREQRPWVMGFGSEDEMEGPVRYVLECEEVWIRSLTMLGILEETGKRSAKDAVIIGRI